MNATQKIMQVKEMLAEMLKDKKMGECFFIYVAWDEEGRRKEFQEMIEG